MNKYREFILSATEVLYMLVTNAASGVVSFATEAKKITARTAGRTTFR
jgi:hypothetical protein